MREKIIAMLGGLPERNPLNPIVGRVLERDGYRIENVMFQSRPNFWVTGNLYVPTSGAGPFPGIISPCGHYAKARLYPAYQFLYLDLVRNGFVVLAYDPIGQGERRNFWNPRTNESEIGGPAWPVGTLPPNRPACGEVIPEFGTLARTVGGEGGIASVWAYTAIVRKTNAKVFIWIRL